jgi:hypothetical protein
MVEVLRKNSQNVGNIENLHLIEYTHYVQNTLITYIYHTKHIQNFEHSTFSLAVYEHATLLMKSKLVVTTGIYHILSFLKILKMLRNY